MKRTFVYVIVGLILVYLFGIIIVNYLINNGYTNSESKEIVLGGSSGVYFEPSNREIYKYIDEHPEHQKSIEQSYIYFHGTGLSESWFPENNGGLDFVIKGIYKRKKFVDGVNYYSDLLGIDSDIVFACVLGEQIRIANKGARGKLKDIIIGGTPTLFRSYNISLGIGGIKFTTAKKIRYDASKTNLYSEYIQYKDIQSIGNDIITDEKLIEDDYFNAKYATYLVANIMERRKDAGYYIGDNPGVVCTLYNMGNPKEKEPHGNPKIGGAVIKIGDKKYVYGGLSEGVYWYLKIYLNKK